MLKWDLKVLKWDLEVVEMGFGGVEMGFGGVKWDLDAGTAKSMKTGAKIGLTNLKNLDCQIIKNMN